MSKIRQDWQRIERTTGAWCIRAQKKRREREAPGMYCRLHYFFLTRVPLFVLTHTNRPLWSPDAIRAQVFPAEFTVNASSFSVDPFATVHTSVDEPARFARMLRFFNAV